MTTPTDADEARTEVAVQNLVHRCAELMDLGEAEAAAALFDGATLIVEHDGVSETHDGAAAVLTGHLLPTMVGSRSAPRSKHIVTNLAVTVRADGATAEARSYLTVLQAPTAGAMLQPVRCGRQLDELARVGDAWRFRSRRIIVDLDHGQEGAGHG
ncbi:MAG: dioxygenase beta subunit [Acidimicrobiales bacterium]|nr:dioxygenase beta subunit [Acidimicrobiales bacterium]